MCVTVYMVSAIWWKLRR